MRGARGPAGPACLEPVVVSLGVVAASVAGPPSVAAQERAKRITVQVGDHAARRGDSSLTDESESDVERSLSGRPWLELVERDAEVTVDVTSRIVSEASRATVKDGSVSITWSHVLRATILTSGERDRIDASTTPTETLTPSEAAQARAYTRQDSSSFLQLGRDLAARVNSWILARLDVLRPARPDAGFRHAAKYKWGLRGDGLEVTEVLPRSPAALAGLERRDRIRSIDGEKGTEQMDLRARTWWFDPPGGRVRLEVERSNTRRVIECAISRHGSGRGLNRPSPAGRHQRRGRLRPALGEHLASAARGLAGRQRHRAKK